MYLVSFINDTKSRRLVLSNCAESSNVSGEVVDEVLTELVADSLASVHDEMKALIFRALQKEKVLLSDPRNDEDSL